MGVDVGTIGTLLVHNLKPNDICSILRAIGLSFLKSRSTEGATCTTTPFKHSADSMDILVALPQVKADEDIKEGDSNLDWAKLLPSGLFYANLGLFTIDFICLNEVRQVLKQMANMVAVHTLTSGKLIKFTLGYPKSDSIRVNNSS